MKIKRALLIGINYENDPSIRLNGAINDATNMRNFLIQNQYFTANEITMMTDNSTGILYPTRANILNQFNVMLQLALSTNVNVDSVVLFVSYSGHATFIRDTNGDEEDGRDEMICPIDFRSAGCILDDVLKKIFINKLPKNTKLSVLMDACNSGTLLDLKYNYLIDRTNTFKVYGDMFQTKAQVVLISGSRDDQLSVETVIGNITKLEQGVLTAAFISNYAVNISLYHLMTKIRNWVRNHKFTQIPQLSSGRLLNTRTTPNIYLEKNLII